MDDALVRELPSRALLPGFPAVEYRDVPDNYGYVVSNTGTVWSCRNSGFLEWRQLGTRKNKWGYLSVKIALCSPEGKPKSRLRFIHRLVLGAFIGPCPDGFECRHLDGNPGNNLLDNLCWGTHQENVADMMKHGRFPDQRGFHNGRSKLKDSDIYKIRELYSAGMSSCRIGPIFGVSQVLVSSILRGVAWKHL